MVLSGLAPSPKRHRYAQWHLYYVEFPDVREIHGDLLVEFIVHFLSLRRWRMIMFKIIIHTVLYPSKTVAPEVGPSKPSGHNNQMIKK